MTGSLHRAIHRWQLSAGGEDDAEPLSVVATQSPLRALEARAAELSWLLVCLVGEQPKELPMDAIHLLKQHHRSAEAALKKLCRAYDRAVLDQLANELAAHMVIEETIFYPAVESVDPELVLEGYEEHAMAEFALRRLLATHGSDRRFEARATALRELVQHHVKEEEEDLFPHVAKKLDGDLLRSLGQRMSQKFDDLVARGHDAVLPRQASHVTGDRTSQRYASSNGRARHA